MKITLHPEAEKTLRDMKILTVTKKEIARYMSFLKSFISDAKIKGRLKNIMLEKDASKVIIEHMHWDVSEKGLDFWYEKYKEAEKIENKLRASKNQHS